jgi:hypothetical protein
VAPRLVAQRERRTALVIGNGAYGADGRLNNPPNDARDVAKALRQLGFEVTERFDLDQQQMEEEIEKFNRQLRQGGVGLFYYSGHGVQVSEVNYLIPIGAKINREQDVRYKTIPLEQVLGAMEDAGNKVNIVILDACRDDPFIRRFTKSSSRGLAPITKEPDGMLIAFATAPGDVARDGDAQNSPYTASLLQHIQEPVPLPLMFEKVAESVQQQTGGQQKPRYVSSGIGGYGFKSIVPPSPSPSPRPTVPPPIPSPAEPTLISKATGVNYTQLRDLLTAGKWEEANLETRKEMLQAAGRTEEGWFRGEDIDQFSCEDLRIIDPLWVDASDGKFGFSVQSQIYRGLGGTEEYNIDIWRKFGDQVGWRRGGTWLSYDGLTFNLTGSRGHLPLWREFGVGGTWLGRCEL